VAEQVVERVLRVAAVALQRGWPRRHDREEHARGGDGGGGGARGGLAVVGVLVHRQVHEELGVPPDQLLHLLAVLVARAADRKPADPVALAHERREAEGAEEVVGGVAV
jgi:hypothetical protein